MSVENGLCNFAYPGTYGHECGAKAMFVGFKESQATKSGVYYAARCEHCRNVMNGENHNVFRWEVLDNTKHINEWR